MDITIFEWVTGTVVVLAIVALLRFKYVKCGTDAAFEAAFTISQKQAHIGTLPTGTASPGLGHGRFTITVALDDVRQVTYTGDHHGVIHTKYGNRGDCLAIREPAAV